MTEPLRRADAPPEAGPKFWVWRVRPGQGFHGQIISPSVWGVFTHYDGDRTRECYQDTKKCQRCLDGMSSRWRGYLYVWNAHLKTYGFLELTGDACEELWRQVGDKHAMRGRLLEVKRKGANIRGILDVKCYPSAGDASTLPEPIDPEETLRKLWSWVKYR